MFRTVAEKVVYENPWMSVEEHSILRDDEPGMYGVVKRSNSSVVIIRDADFRFLMLNQYRFPTKQNSWELPMGGIDEGETPEQAAVRELEEETGIEVTTVGEVGSFFAIPGLTPQKVWVFEAVVAAEVLDASMEKFKPVDEILEKKLMNWGAIVQAVSMGEISDGFTLSSFSIFQMNTR